MSWRRVRGIMLQNFYVMKRSPIRLMEVFYWPLLEVVVWGYITVFLARQQASIPGGVGVLLGAVLLWDVMFRSQQELSVPHLIDMWDRNILNLHASPVRQSEYVAGGIIFSIARVIVGTTVLILVAHFGFGFNLFTAGATLVPALTILVVMGWSLGLVIRAAILRFGSNAEILAWSVAFLLQPVAAVFYPVDVLPGWLQAVSRLIPVSYVFEALRAFLADGEVLAAQLAFAGVLVVGYFFAAAWLAGFSYQKVRQLGLLTRPGY
ncbi:MAG: ABC transporter permease [Acidimicrobiia bacterium]